MNQSELEANTRVNVSSAAKQKLFSHELVCFTVVEKVAQAVILINHISELRLSLG